ncbi:copine-9 isoform X6 [Ictalurus punctatus]|uniref:Copine-9 isoform X6 n=1 Tax=Ictalurus punctatus TaxID=7998 RepID=A0A9F7TR27_ICTPU|nr:copine-9 isoform X6 [Ictalurus punctatus]
MASIGDFDPLNTSVPATKIEVTVSCRNLLDVDTFSKSDPVVVLYVQGIGTKEWREFGRTEMIENTLNPDFVRKFVLDYFFEEKQNLRFDVYNVDSRSSNISKHVASLRHHLCVNSVSLSWARLSALWERSLARLELVWRGCCRVSQARNAGTSYLQQRSSAIAGTVKVDVYDWDRDGSHDFIGEFTTSYRELSRGQSQFNVYEVLNPKKKGRKKKYINSGTVTLLSFKVESEYTFVDFIRGGTQLNFTVAIDFTASNGNPSQPTSLHYMSPYQMNAYAMALKAVGEIIQDYDSDKLFPAYGFGAKIPPDGNVSHAFPLNSDCENANCVGIEGVLEAYYECLRTVQLYGPTNFAPVISQVAEAAAGVTDGSQYFVLLMITDGVISDMVQTKEAVVNASSLPMSIIIVGVGPAEFDAMEELDGDEIRVSSRGRVAERDIVQFVPFRDYIDRSGNQVLSMARLAKDVLAEIPEQLLSFMKSRGIEPRPALSHSPTPHIHIHL